MLQNLTNTLTLVSRVAVVCRVPFPCYSSSFRARLNVQTPDKVPNEHLIGRVRAIHMTQSDELTQLTEYSAGSHTGLCRTVFRSVNCMHPLERCQHCRVELGNQPIPLSNECVAAFLDSYRDLGLNA